MMLMTLWYKKVESVSVEIRTQTDGPSVNSARSLLLLHIMYLLRSIIANILVYEQLMVVAEGVYDIIM